MNGLQARDLTCGYGARRVFAHLSLDVPPGQVLALLGPNGAGKTTLLKALGRLMRPQQGSVLFRGRDVWNESPGEAARHTALMPQSESCNWPLTVTEAVLLGRTPHRGWLAPFRAEDQAIVAEALARLHLEPLRERPITQLSGGEWRRVMLARALAQQPRVLLLDEPTAQLDLKHQVEILAYIRGLAQQENLIVVLTLHDLNQAAQHADRVGLLAAGGELTLGTPVQVLRADLLSRVFDVRVTVVSHPVFGVPLVVPVADGSSAAAGLGNASRQTRI